MDEDHKLTTANSLDSYQGQKLNEVIRSITSEKGISRIDSIEIIYNELEHKKYTLIDVNPPKNFLRFLFSLYNLSFWLTIIFIGLTLYSITILPQVYPYLYIRYICTLLLTLFIPGYLIMEIVIPSNLQSETLLKISLGTIISFLMDSVLGYMIISASFSFTDTSIAVALLCITISISLVWSIKKYLQRIVYNED